MRKRLIFWPYKMGSKSCKVLARALGALRVFSNRNYRPRRRHVIVNWGNSVSPNWFGQCDRILNIPRAVAKAANKLYTLQTLTDNDVSVPQWTTDSQVAADWDRLVYCRRTVTGRGGSGIVVATCPDEIVPAPLYTAGVDVAREFRVHVVEGEVIDYTEKKRMSSERLEDYGLVRNDLIRNHDNGWVFCRGDVELPDSVADMAIKAVDAIGLDFGAVDICLSTNDEAIVFEVNTAPGVEGTTLEKYTQAFGELV